MFCNSCKSCAIYFLSPILKYSAVLSELMSKKSYTVYIPENYISLLQFTKYIILKSFLKCVWKGFEIVLRRYLIFKTLNFMHTNSPGSSGPTNNAMCDLSEFYFRFVTYWTDLVKSSSSKRCFIKQVKV